MGKNIVDMEKKASYRILALLGAIAISTKATALERPAVFTDTIAAAASSPAELPLPTVPSTLTVPEERAAYIAAHFWDAMDFADTTLTADRDFMEQNFANFANLLPYSTEQGVIAAVKTLMAKAAASATAYRTVADIAEKYLYDPNSPMLNEELYIEFLEETTRSTLLSKAERDKQAFYLRCAMKNRRGSVAADFGYIDRQGRRQTLHGTKAERLVLIFYDPDCEHCTEIMTQLKNNSALHDSVSSGNIKILAIYSDGDRRLWDNTKDSLPAEWTVGFDTSGIQEHGTYILRAMPTIYILDGEKKVLAKDVNIN